ncbi:MAG: TetR/AcrR family transcriptional regulator [Vulcanimicrobiota bacterium]
METHQGQEVKEKILWAATGLFARRGYHGASMKGIAEAAEVNKASLFYYFTSKNNLYSTVFQNLYDSFIHELKQAEQSSHDIHKRMENLLRAYMKQFSESRQFVKLFIREFLDGEGTLKKPPQEFVEDLRRPLLDLFREGKQAGVFGNIDEEYLSMAIVGSLQVFYRLPLKIADEIQDEKVFETIMNLLKNGIYPGSDN